MLGRRHLWPFIWMFLLVIDHWHGGDGRLWLML
jgi:hypothetical protein